jgi:hypothetical protein
MPSKIIATKMNVSLTQSESNTFTTARAKYVFGKIKEDIYAIAYRGFTKVTEEKILGWWEDIFFAAQHQALVACQIQFGWQGGTAAIKYAIESSGQINLDTESAQQDFYKIPADADIRIVVTPDFGNRTVMDYFDKRGWGSNGSFLPGQESAAGGYSKDGYGAHISTIGL